MRKWIMAAGLAIIAMPGLVTADNDGYVATQSSNYSSQNTCYMQQPCCNTGCFLVNWCNLFCSGCWEFGGEGLHWRVCGNDQAFALQEATVGTDTTLVWHKIKPDNDWGFRLKGKYTTCDGCLFASLSYLYFDQSERALAGSNATLINPYFPPDPLDVISAFTHPEYQRLDGRVGHYICSSCCGGFYGYGGVSWIYIREGERLDATNITSAGYLNQSSRFTAAGFEVGFGGHYYFCGGFGIAGELGGVAAIGQRRFRFELANTVSSTTTSFVFRNSSVSSCVPGLDVKLELFYDCFICCHNITFMVGYEEQYYWNPLHLNRLFFGTDQLQALRFSEKRDFGAGGLYIGAKIRL